MSQWGKRDPVDRRFDVDVEHIRAYSHDPKFGKRLALSRERGEDVVLGVHRMYRVSRGTHEIELYFRGRPRVEAIKRIAMPPEEWKGWGYVIMKPEQTRNLVGELIKVIIPETPFKDEDKEGFEAFEKFVEDMVDEMIDRVSEEARKTIGRKRPLVK